MTDPTPPADFFGCRGGRRRDRPYDDGHQGTFEMDGARLQPDCRDQILNRVRNFCRRALAFRSPVGHMYARTHVS